MVCLNTLRSKFVEPCFKSGLQKCFVTVGLAPDEVLPKEAPFRRYPGHDQRLGDKIFKEEVASLKARAYLPTCH